MSRNSSFLRWNTGKFIAICAITTLLCASCATTSSRETEKKDPKEISELYSDLGTEALMRGEPSQAIGDLKKALSLDPNNVVARNHLGLAYYALGDKKSAKIEIEKSILIDPKYSDGFINLGKLAEDDKNYHLAKHYYRKALDNPEYKTRHRALTNLAQLALRENKTDEAKQLLYQSLQTNPDYCFSNFLLGSLLLREGNAKRAAESFKKSVASVCTNNVEGHYQLGLAYLRSKDFQKARATFVHVVEHFPQTKEAQSAGEQLRNLP
ncbi:MAG: tetratricopeptide repeat protein [Bdellovibrionota bacterium]